MAASVRGDKRNFWGPFPHPASKLMVVQIEQEQEERQSRTKQLFWPDILLLWYIPVCRAVSSR